MSKIRDIESCLTKSIVIMNAVYATILKDGNPGAIQLLREAILACENVLFDSEESNVQKQNDVKSRSNELFHRTWTKAVGTPGYDKEEWKELERLIFHA